jgi:hypothetical protein
MGLAKADPIVLPNITANEVSLPLESALSNVRTTHECHVMGLEPFLDSMSTSRSISLSEKEWIDVLRVTTFLHFNDYRKPPIDTLKGSIKKPVQRIMLAREHSISTWLISGFEMLVNQPTSMTEQQASLIGKATAIRFFIIRDSLFQSTQLL